MGESSITKLFRFFQGKIGVNIYNKRIFPFDCIPRILNGLSICGQILVRYIKRHNHLFTACAARKSMNLAIVMPHADSYDMILSTS